MIAGTVKKSEHQYRQIELDSSSSLKDFSQDRKRYYKKYVAGEVVEDEETKAILMGNLVDCLLLCPEEWESKFFMSICQKSPTEKMLDFTNALLKHTELNCDDDGALMTDFENIARQAYQDSGFKWSFEKVMQSFQGSDAENYYREKRLAKGKSVVCVQDIDNAHKIIEELQQNQFVSHIINSVDSEEVSVYNQLKHEFVYEGLKLKLMVDKVEVHHETKEISPYDLKVTWAVEHFYKDYYLYRRAYIPGLIYTEGVIDWAKDVYPGYKVNPLKFIVADSINYYLPLIYTMSKQDLSDAYYGFTESGRKYPGVNEIIRDLLWAKEHDIWTISRKNYQNNCIVNLKDNV